jgi:glycosyltransferase involved in cell wall biosynthesis
VSEKVAIVHDWLVTPGGAELVLEEMLAVFPDADVFTMIDQRPPDHRDSLGKTRVHTSWMQRIPNIKQKYRSYLPVMPLALKSLNVSKYDLVISNSHAVAKGIHTHSRQVHLCYCLSPMRYAWDLRDQYLHEAGLDSGVKGAAAVAMLEGMRRWDLANTSGVKAFATLSNYIAERIKRAYGRSSVVIYPPVDTDFFTLVTEPREDFFVTASRFVPYKRVDMIASAFRAVADRRLIVIGDGPDVSKVRAAAGHNVEMVGRLSREEVRSYLRRAKAFVFAAEEDFGIAPVEAQACGTPVIAFGRGGVTETIVDGFTGVFYAEQTAEALADAVRRFEGMSIEAAACRDNALRFSSEKFRSGFRSFVDGEL